MISAYGVLDGLRVEVAGSCQTAHPDSGRCEGQRASTVLPASEVERYGEGLCIDRGIQLLLRENPSLAEYVIH